MQLRTKGYLLFITIVIFLEILMIRLYVNAANSFDSYQLSDVFNFTKDNDYEGGIGLLLGAIVFQVCLVSYLIYQDKKIFKTIKKALLSAFFVRIMLFVHMVYSAFFEQFQSNRIKFRIFHILLQTNQVTLVHLANHKYIHLYK